MLEIDADAHTLSLKNSYFVATPKKAAILPAIGLKIFGAVWNRPFLARNYRMQQYNIVLILRNILNLPGVSPAVS